MPPAGHESRHHRAVDRDIHSPGRFVRDQERRLQHECLRQRHALTLPATELMRQHRHQAERQSHRVDQGRHDGGSLILLEPAIAQVDRFCDVLRDGEARVQAIRRILGEVADIARSRSARRCPIRRRFVPLTSRSRRRFADSRARGGHGSREPATAVASVDFPDPLSPIRPSTSPRPMSKLTPSIARTVRPRGPRPVADRQVTCRYRRLGVPRCPH